MKILIVADAYPPEVSSAAHLMQELAQGFHGRGHEVTVVTSYPQHYLVSGGSPSSLRTVEQEEGIRVVRVRVLPHHKVHLLFRGISQLLLPFKFWKGIRAETDGDFDVAIVYSPPLPLALVGAWMKKRYGTRFILNLQDIFPQNAIDLGLFRKQLKFRWLERLAILFFERIERSVYRNADAITFHSEGGRDFLIRQKNVPPEKIHTVYNWADLEGFRNSIPKHFREAWGLQDAFLLLFGGVFGPAQGLEFILEVASRVTDLSNLRFLLVGDGMERDTLEKSLQSRKIQNVLLRPFLSKEDYPSLVAESDVGVVCLSSKNKTPFVPGKLVGYFAAGKPVLAFLNRESDGFEVIRKADAGHAVPSDDPAAAERAVRALYANRKALERLGQNAQSYAEKNFDLHSIIPAFERLCESGVRSS